MVGFLVWFGLLCCFGVFGMGFLGGGRGVLSGVGWFCGLGCLGFFCKKKFAMEIWIPFLLNSTSFKDS